MDEVMEFMETINEGIKKNEAIMWAIALKENPSKLIGTICYWKIQNQNYRAELGYTLHPQYWRKGIMKDAILKVIEYGFKTVQFHSIEARIHAGNKASAAVLESTGFVQEGYLKEEFFFGEKFSDTIIYSRLQ
jgi:ribosomal-protein-alanine N-acetyltransferase